MSSVLLVLSLLGAGCKADPPDTPTDPTAAEVPEDGGIGEISARRLSRDELDNVLFDIVGDDRRVSATFLPPDVIDPFDNQISNQEPTPVVVSGLEALANDVATTLLADPARRDAVLGCVPVSDTDEACFATFVSSFGRLALRRSLTADEVDRFVAAGVAFATDTGDFYEGVDVLLRAILQHPEFVYRIERGAPTDEAGVFRLNGNEVATRLSFLIWGSSPDAALLDLAESGGLETPDQLRSAATTLLADPRARTRVDRFHAMWLGYWSLPHPEALTNALRAETRALVEDVVFDRQAPWLELFTADGTFVDDTLATHYGLPLPGSATGSSPAGGPTWVSYAGTTRMGLLSQGAFLSVNAKFGDTSPTLRGKLIRERLLCQDIPPPPPTVNVDEAPEGDDPGDCKVDRYEEHRAVGACHSCHQLMDPMGFGLENYDREGRFRTHDDGDASCTISGDGEIDGVAFNGPKGLAEQLVAGSDLPACAVLQIVRFATGHEVGAFDLPLVDRLTAGWEADGYLLDALILGLVGDDTFLYRREPEVTP